MSRHPFTYACDFVRSLGPVNSGGVVLSRADAGQIIKGIAAAVGMTEEELAVKLSEAEQQKTQDDFDRQADRLVKAIMGGDA